MLGQATKRQSLVARDPVTEQLDALEDRLPRQLAGAHASERVVRQWVQEERRRYRSASIRTFIPILVQRAVAERAGRPVSAAVQSSTPSGRSS